MLSFGVLTFWHDGQSPLLLASERSVLDGDGFKVVVSDVEDKRGSFTISIYVGEGTGAYATDLEVGVVV